MSDKELRVQWKTLDSGATSADMKNAWTTMTDQMQKHWNHVKSSSAVTVLKLSKDFVTWELQGRFAQLY
jgi:hypothetical protein